MLASKHLLDELQNLSEIHDQDAVRAMPQEISQDLVKFGLIRENPKARGFYLLTDDSRRFLLRLASGSY